CDGPRARGNGPIAPGSFAPLYFEFRSPASGDNTAPRSCRGTGASRCPGLPTSGELMLEEAFQKYERLPTELAEEIPGFTPELKSGLAEFAREARDRGKSEAYRARAEALERKRGPALWSDYLLAQIANQANDEPAWERELLKIGDRLAQASAWAQAREIGEEILGSHPSAPAARLAVRAIEALGDDAALDDA